MQQSRRIVSLSAVTILASACVVNPQMPRSENDGMMRVQSQRVDAVYKARGASLAAYRRVMIDPVVVQTVARPGVPSSGPQAEAVAKIRDLAASVFRETLVRELATDAGYPATETAGPDVLRVTATLSGLEVELPAGVGATADSAALVAAGALTLSLELRDSASNALLVRATDRPRGREFGNLQVLSNANTSEEVRRAFTKWARLLRSALDAAAR